MNLRPHRVLFLDRDGVINQDSPNYIKHPDEWVPIPGSIEAIARATRAGFRIIVLTNQSAVGRGLIDLDTLHAIHARMLSTVRNSGGRIDAVMFCPHRPDEHCECRKPMPGLLLEAASRLNVAPDSTIMVGDKISDLKAAGAAGARAILVRTGLNDIPRDALASLATPPAVVDDLAAAVDLLISETDAEASSVPSLAP